MENRRSFLRSLGTGLILSSALPLSLVVNLDEAEACESCKRRKYYEEGPNIIRKCGLTMFTCQTMQALDDIRGFGRDVFSMDETVCMAMTADSIFNKGKMRLVYFDSKNNPLHSNELEDAWGPGAYLTCHIRASKLGPKGVYYAGFYFKDHKVGKMSFYTVDKSDFSFRAF